MLNFTGFFFRNHRKCLYLLHGFGYIYDILTEFTVYVTVFTKKSNISVFRIKKTGNKSIILLLHQLYSCHRQF